MIVPETVKSLQVFVDAGVLTEADIHVTETLMRSSGTTGTNVAARQIQLATALAVRAPRHGHVCVDLATVAETIVADTRVLDHYGGTGDPLADVAWPDPKKWIKQLAKASTLVRPSNSLDMSAADMARTALVLDGANLYLDRYFTYELSIAESLKARAAAKARDHRIKHPDAIDHLFGTDPADLQRKAAYAMATQSLTVLVGGPGTGKTRTIARALAAEVLANQDLSTPFRVALAAPTGKAASRLGEAIGLEVASADLSHEVAEQVLNIEPSTVHKLLGFRSRIQFRHDERSPLPHDLIIVDEVSMVSVPLMARLLSAVGPSARIVLVGDPFQLASVEAGAVLGDIVQGAKIAPNMVRLKKVHRFAETSGIAKLAEAIAAGDSELALDLLSAEGDLEWIQPDDEAGRNRLERLAASQAAEVVTAAGEGRSDDALAAGTQFKILCGTRHGPLGLRAWQQTIEQRTAGILGHQLTGRWYAGRPVIVTRNDYLNQLANGDVGVVLNTPDGLRVAIAGAERSMLAPSQLESVETWWAMTIHKSQGSEFAHVALSLPEAPAPILTRELLYTAVTRAKEKLTVFCSSEAIRTAIETPITRNSGLRGLLS